MWKPADPAYPPDFDPGQAIHYITFLNQVTVSDASGIAVKWLPGSPPVKKWARIQEPRGQTVIKNGQDVTQVDAIVTIRYWKDLIENMRFQDARGNVYLILAAAKKEGMEVATVMQCVIVGTNV